MAQVPYSPNPSVEPQLTGPTGAITAQATPAMALANVTQQAGETGVKLGGEATSIATQYIEKASEASADDMIVNQFTPAAAAARAEFYQNKGKDASTNLGNYQNALTDVRDQVLGQATNPYQAQILRSYMVRHAANEIDGASRYAADEQTKYMAQASAAFVGVQSDNAVNNYNNPNIVSESMISMSAKIQATMADHGIHTDTPEGLLMVQQAQREATGKTVEGMVGRAVLVGDINQAHAIYNAYKDQIPGAQQLQIDKTMHAEDMRYFGASAGEALLKGLPIPPQGGDTALLARTATASAAQTAGVDPNQALTVLRIESSDGMNLGSRGDIGQTGKPAKTMDEQASNLVSALKNAQDTATNALERKCEPWEAYTCYQQGVGGGPALLKADPNARAVDVLTPLYGDNLKIALSAVQNNGGNANMTVGQFLDQIKQKYNNEAPRAAVNAPTGGSVVDAMVAPHQGQTPPFQPAATPLQNYKNFNEVFPDALARANTIPNLDQRESTIKYLDQQHAVFSTAANAYKSNAIMNTQKLADDPKFTDMSQIPTDTRAILTDFPQQQLFLEKRAKYNLANAGNAAAADKYTLGTNIFDVMQNVYKPISDPQSVHSPDQLMQLENEGKITPAGYDAMKKEIESANTPEGRAAFSLKSALIDTARQSIVPNGAGDVIGQAKLNNWLSIGMAQYDAGIAQKKTPQDLLTPSSPDYVGKSIIGFVRSQKQMMADTQKAALLNIPGVNTAFAAIKTPQELLGSMTDAMRMSREKGNDPAAIEAAYKAEAIHRGWAKEDPEPDDTTPPTVPVLVR